MTNNPSGQGVVMSRARIWAGVVIIMAVLTSGALVLADPETERGTDTRSKAPASVPASTQQSPFIREIPTTTMRLLQSSYEPSMEMRENVVFVLSPALLMQEALSPDLVITYPNE